MGTEIIGRVYEENYNSPIIPLITITNRAGTRTILEHDVSKENNTLFSPFEITVENGVRKTGTFKIRCFDDHGYLRTGEIPFRGRIQVKARKPFQSAYESLLKGLIIDINKVERYSNGSEEWEITGQSIKHIWDHTIVDIEMNAPFINLKENEFNLKTDDKKFYIGNVIHDIMTRRDIFPNNNGYNVMERTGCTINGIDKTIPLTIPGIKHRGPVSSLLNTLAENAGIFLGIDEDGDMYARPPVYKSTGHIIKTWTDPKDNPDLTCYTRFDISTGASTDPSQYAEVVIGQADTSQVVTNNSATDNFTTLYNKDIAVQIDIRSTFLFDLTLILSKLNAGTNSANPENTNLRGFIVDDVNNRIGTEIVAHLTIPLREIPATPEPVSRRNVTFIRPINPTKKYWLVLMEIGSSDQNTVLWWHDDGVASSNGAQTFVAIRDIPYGRNEKEAYAPEGWRVIKNQQLYSHTFTLRSPIMHVSNTIFAGKEDDYLDPAPVEVVQNPNFVNESSSMMQFMAIFNEYVSRIVKSHNFGEVSIPNRLLRPGTAVVYLDTRGFQHAVSLTDVSYNFTLGENNILGTNRCTIAGISYILPAVGDSLDPTAQYASFYCR